MHIEDYIPKYPPGSLVYHVACEDYHIVLGPPYSPKAIRMLTGSSIPGTWVKAYEMTPKWVTIGEWYAYNHLIELVTYTQSIMES